MFAIMGLSMNGGAGVAGQGAKGHWALILLLFEVSVGWFGIALGSRGGAGIREL